MKLNKVFFVVMLLPVFAVAGEDMSAPEPEKRVEKSRDIYAIGAIGSGRSGGENSVSVGAGVGMTLSKAERATLSAELTANHFGTYHTDATNCSAVSVSSKWKKSQQVTVCDQSTSDVDYVGALGELKMNWTQPRVQPLLDHETDRH